MVGEATTFPYVTTYPGISGSTAIPSLCTSGDPTYTGWISGTGTLFPNSAVTMVQITDGTSNTIFVGEQSDNMRGANGAVIALPAGTAAAAYNTEGGLGWEIGGRGADTRTPPAWNGDGNSNALNGNAAAFNVTTIKYTINQWGMSSANPGTSNSPVYAPCPNAPLSSTHNGFGGANAAFADGTVRFIANSIPLAILQSLADRADGQVFDLSAIVN
jgi:prepilin-type processing-associated H-X9-DG protein